MNLPDDVKAFWVKEAQDGREAWHRILSEVEIWLRVAEQCDGLEELELADFYRKSAERDKSRAEHVISRVHQIEGYLAGEIEAWW